MKVVIDEGNLYCDCITIRTLKHTLENINNVAVSSKFLASDPIGAAIKT